MNSVVCEHAASAIVCSRELSHTRCTSNRSRIHKNALLEITCAAKRLPAMYHTAQQLNIQKNVRIGLQQHRELKRPPAEQHVVRSTENLSGPTARSNDNATEHESGRPLSKTSFGRPRYCFINGDGHRVSNLVCIRPYARPTTSTHNNCDARNSARSNAGIRH